MVRFRCKVCKRRVNVRPIFTRDNRRVIFRCPLCLSSGVFRNNDFIPVLFVKKIVVAPSINYFGVRSSQPVVLGDAQRIKPPMMNSHKVRR